MSTAKDRSRLRIEARVRGRKAAQEIHELLTTNCYEEREYYAAIVEELTKLWQLSSSSPAPSQPELIDPLSGPTPISLLGETLIPFGKYADQTFDKTPFAYLDWLCRSFEESGNKSQLYLLLKQYLRHPDLASRRRGVDP